jgi:hypothetical protein
MSSVDIVASWSSSASSTAIAAGAAPDDYIADGVGFRLGSVSFARVGKGNAKKTGRSGTSEFFPLRNCVVLYFEFTWAKSCFITWHINIEQYILNLV